MRFFGGGGSSEEQVASSSLIQKTNSLFNEKVKDLDSKASVIVSGLESAKKEFILACDEFENSQKEPDTDDMYYVTSTTYLKDNKKGYVKALKRVIALGTADVGHENIYTKYNSQLSSAENMLNGILRTNKAFHSVLGGYANELGRFKKAFSAIEKQVNSLKREIELRSADFEQHTNLYKETQNFLMLLDESRLIDGTSKEVSAQKGAGIDPDTSQEISRKIENKRRERDSIISKRVSSVSKISITLLALDKPARKYEHTLYKKTILIECINNPIETIRNEGIYREFQDLIKKLWEEIDTNRIEVKNKDTIKDSVDLVMNGTLLNWLNEVKQLDLQISPMENELHYLSSMVHDIEDAEAERRKSEDFAKSLEGKKTEIKEEIEKSRKNLEKQIFEYYKKRVKILIA